MHENVLAYEPQDFARLLRQPSRCVDEALVDRQRTVDGSLRRALVLR
jgi:hypothetical protein